MGVGKTIEAIGLSDVFNDDYYVVIETLANRFECNIDVNSYNSIENDRFLPKEKIFDFGYSKTYHLLIFFSVLKNKNGDVKINPTIYELTIPDTQPINENLYLSFFSNNTVHVQFFDFDSRWEVFFDTVFSWCLRVDEEVAREKYLEIRNAYWKILKKIGCDKIVILTDYYYKLFNILSGKPPKVKSFNDIIEYAKKNDNLLALNLLAAMKPTRNYSDWFHPNITSDDCFSYVFVDEADAEQKELSLEWKGEMTG